MYIRRLTHILLLLFLILVPMAELKAESPESLKEQCFSALKRSDFPLATKLARRLLKEAKGKPSMEVYGHIGLAQALVMLGDKKAYPHLMTAYQIAAGHHMEKALCSVYNGLGLYSANIENDTYSALDYYFEGLRLARVHSRNELYPILLANVSSICFLRNDTTGLRYALETYQLGKEEHNNHLVFIGALSLANMYYLKDNYQAALNNVEEAHQLMNRLQIADTAQVYGLYGIILSKTGRKDKAIQIFEQGLQTNQGQTSHKVFLLLKYAQLQRNNGAMVQARQLLTDAYRLTFSEHNPIFREQIIEELARCEEAEGHLQAAIQWQKELLNYIRKSFDHDKERMLNHQRARFELQQQENKLQQQRIQLMTKERRILILTFIVIFLVSLCLLVVYRYRRQRKLFASIVRQNKEALRREEQLKHKINILEAEKDESSSNPPVKYASSSLALDRKDELFRQLEESMSNQSLFKDNLLTKDKVAELLQTNRTYLSQVINEKTGKTFTQYINDYRIREAIRILSSPGVDLPMKAISADLGFNSMTTFYKLFQAEVGMTPRQYREQVVSIDVKAYHK